MAKEILLQASKIEKSFGSNHVLLGAGFSIYKGEVMSLLGENGAGKSTLVKIITGVYDRDSGTITMDGVEFPKTFDKAYAEKNGISIIYQELSVIPTLTVAQNIYLNREPKNKLGMIDYKKLRANAQALVERYGFDLDVNAYVESLSIAKRQLVEIVKALAFDAKLLIMDEPTASLSEKEVEKLFQIIRTLKDKGISILYISHRLKEIYQITDRLTVLRDGREVLVCEKEELDANEVVSAMIGRKLKANDSARQLRGEENECILEVRGLCGERFHDINFRLMAGEVLALTGLVGAGRTELVRAIFGADKFEKGEIYLNGKPFKPSLKNALKYGFALVPEDRRTQGFVPDIDVSRNVGITNFDQIGDAIGVSRRKETELANKMIKAVGINPPDPRYRVVDMSGGNQQKVVLAKWLARDLKVFICDEPTSGVDVGAKEEIYGIIHELCKQNVGVLLVSSDVAEVTRVADRILIMHNGYIIKEFNEGEASEEEIVKASSGILEEGEARHEKES